MRNCAAAQLQGAARQAVADCAAACTRELPDLCTVNLEYNSCVHGRPARNQRNGTTLREVTKVPIHLIGTLSTRGCLPYIIGIHKTNPNTLRFPAMLQSHAGSRSVARTHGAVAHLPHLAQAPAASAHLTAALGDVSCYHHCQAAHTKHVCLRQRATVRCAASSADASPATSAVPSTQWIQRVIELPSFPRGCHIVTSRIRDAVPEIAEYEMGLANLFIQHTSASLTINENASPDVALDLNDAMDRIVPEGAACGP